MKISMKGSAQLGPLPVVLVTCRGADGRANVFTAAWTGTVCTNPPMAYVSVRPSRRSHALISETKELVLHPVPASLVREADWCGTYTGAKVDKFAACGFTAEEGREVGAPVIAECPLALECRVREVRRLGSHDLFLCEIVAVDAEESLFDEKNALHMERAELTAFLHGDYYALGKRLAHIGVSAGKKKSVGRPRGKRG